MSDTLAYEINGRRVAPEVFYAVACDPSRSVAVEACAGAGKTWMLVSRILRALLEGTAPQDILAITFTKKAAGEMRERLHEWLAAFSNAPAESLVQELRLRGLSDEQARERAGALQGLYARMLEAGRPVQVRTFHSWFAALLRTAPLAVLQQLGLPAHYELLEDDSEAVAQVWRPFHAAVMRNAGLMQDFHAVVAAHGRSQTHKALESALAKRVEFALADAHGVVDASIEPFGVQFPACAGLAAPESLLHTDSVRGLLLVAARALGRAGAPTFAAKGMELEQAVIAGDATAVLAALLTQKNEYRKFSDKLAGIEDVRAAQALALQVVQAGEQHAAWLHQQAMARLTRVLIAQFSDLKRERGWVDMNDVERAALVMLADPVLSGWVQQRLDARVRQLLIDEFQDTNPLQWQALHAWLSGYPGAGGGASGADGAPRVFLVGDPKQSIYRFRRAEPQVFRAAQAFVVQGLGGDLLNCDHTRRNAPEVIAAVNAVMLQAQSQGEYEGYRAHSTAAAQHGAVLVLPPIARDAALDPESAAREGGDTWRDSLTTPRVLPEETLRNLECRQAAHWLAAQLQGPAGGQGGLRPQDIMVLSRRRDRLAVMQDELRSLHIPAQQPEKADLADAPEVQDVLALVDVLVSPGHDLSLARALRSPLFGADDADLVALAEAQRAARTAGAASSWLSLLMAAPPPRPVLQDAAVALSRWQAWLAAWPPHDALDAIYHDGDVLARFAKAAPPALRAGVLTNLRALLAAALQLDGARYATPYAFVRALKRGGVKAPASAQADAVRLLTVHGAKGLEAPLVLLLDTDTAPARAETMGVLVEWPGEAAHPQRFAFLASESRPPACTQAALAAEQAARQREELNALYVAMTRARARLVVSSVAPHRPCPGSWRERLAPQGEAIEAIEAPATLAVPHARESFVLPVLPLLPPAPVGLPAPRAEDSLASRVGQAMHRLLEWRGMDSAAPALLAAVAREFQLEPADAQRAQEMAQCIAQGEGAWAFDTEGLSWHGNEVDLLHGGQVLRLDRLVCRRDTGAWWVLDYKSATEPERQEDLRAQLQAYRAAVRAAQPGAVVRAAFLTAHGALVELTEDA